VPAIRISYQTPTPPRVFHNPVEKVMEFSTGYKTSKGGETLISEFSTGFSTGYIRDPYV
jgi:hypothetical protein